MVVVSNNLLRGTLVPQSHPPFWSEWSVPLYVSHTHGRSSVFSSECD